KPGDVPAGAREAGDEAIAHRIGRMSHNNWQGAARLLYRTDRHRSSRHNDIDLRAHKLGSKPRKKLGSSFGKTPFDDEILALYKAKLAHALSEATILTGLN